MSYPDFSPWAPVVLTLVATGGLAGLLAGLFGVGGGAIFVPVLYHTFVGLKVDPAIAMHLSIGTSLAIIVPTSLRSLAAHRLHDAVDMKLLREWVIAVPAGVVVGALIAAAASASELKVIFAGIAFLLGVKMLVGKLQLHLGTDLPGLFGRSVAGLVIGILSSLMGIGGGVLNNTFMSAYGRSMHQAVATSSGVGVLIAIPGLIAYTVVGWGDPRLPPFSLGYISLTAALACAPSSLLAAPFGARLAHRLTKRQLELCFGLFLMAVALQFVWGLV
ncbi:UPF0721 transmembrane protein [Aureimonas sp. SA4125]|uniref:sulfite exporter TauE/SafE family protein n=1 Tax=Aureimonas sp. SA4125 TaxID=2826993 RepID=UPI001CC7FD52|nr:sulfite exporter TauE/SafE family protein [Aureimonas sp. SA4125]BDA82620.1 UPF0721 transmembrane protein [Aureimonas sp. SA4125]